MKEMFLSTSTTQTKLIQILTSMVQPKTPKFGNHSIFCFLLASWQNSLKYSIQTTNNSRSATFFKN